MIMDSMKDLTKDELLNVFGGEEQTVLKLIYVGNGVFKWVKA